jgi:O-antigen ligase
VAIDLAVDAAPAGCRVDTDRVNSASDPPTVSARAWGWPVAACLAAATAPTLLAHNPAPSPTFLNQALAFALWAAFVLASASRFGRGRAGGPEIAIGLLLLAVLVSWGPGTLPSTLALSALGTLAAAALLLQAGRSTSAAAGGRDLFEAFCWGWLVAGLANVGIAFVQVFYPAWAGNDWIASSGLVGRAVGNLRQPNHLSSVLLWGVIATVALAQLGRLRLRWAVPALALMLWAVVLTASRTGLVSVLLLALWGLADRRAVRPLRLVLLAAPLIYAIAWGLMAQWATLTQQTFGGAARLAESDISSSRFAIWADTLALIRAHPWFGVGWGEFNLAWTLTPSPDRPTAFFDHAHNLPLHLAAELGLPLATLVTALLLGSFGQAAWRAWRSEGADGIVRRGAVMVVLMIGMHSLLEYPLWYSYFLLPAAWALGVALRDPAPSSATATVAAPSGRPWMLAVPALLLVLGSAFAAWDYHRVTTIFKASPGAAPLVQRVANGQRSVFFGHHADYAAVTSGIPVADRDAAFARASHYLLDTRFMIAWSQALAQRGELDAAAHLAARLREFRRAESVPFLAVCADAASAAPAFQCRAPAPAFDWRGMTQIRR